VLVAKPLYIIRRHVNSITGEFSISKGHMFSDLLAKSLNLRTLDKNVEDFTKTKLNQKLFSSLKRCFGTKDVKLFIYSIYNSFETFNTEFKIKALKLILIFPIYLISGKGKYLVK
jgi:hypothetical protein